MNIASSTLILGLTVFAVSAYSQKLDEIFAWKVVKFLWPSDEAEQNAIKSGQYIPENNIILGIDKWKTKLFLAVPRLKPGTGFPLSYIQLPTEEKSPKLIPYPSYDANILQPGQKGLTSDSQLISLFRIFADKCDRLWTVDNGLDYYYGGPKPHDRIAPTAAVIFDLNTDKLIRRYALPSSFVKDDSTFTNIIVDIPNGDCGDAFAYITDEATFAIVVYSFKKNHSWRILHSFFLPEPRSCNYFSGGVNFQRNYGILGMALGKAKSDGSAPVYFQAVSSISAYTTSNTILQNSSRQADPKTYYDYKFLGERRQNTHSSALVYHERTGVIFYTLLNKDSIGCWNSKLRYNTITQDIVAHDSERLIFANDLKIDTDDNLWVTSNKAANFVYGPWNTGEYNIRILRGAISELISGTRCALLLN